MKKVKDLIFLHAIILLYALSSVCSKYAAGLPFFSFPWMLVYGGQILVLGLYAILWQQVLKKMPLNFAYANKSVAIIWSMLFGMVLFGETLSVWNALGALLVLIGVIVMGTEKAEVREP